jgi:D-alanyl-D-alanine dipeptidase
MESIKPNDLLPLNAYEKDFPIKIHAAYADHDYEHNHFKGLYSPHAQIMWAHIDFIPVPLLAAKIANHLYGWKFEFKDCLRPVEAQEKMTVYGYDPSLVSTPGSGAHPRAMAIDICVYDKNGREVDMGTPFDHFTLNIDDNPAARNYTKFEGGLKRSQEVWDNRNKLEFCVRFAATALGKEILPIPQEWWDFRFEPDTFNQFKPLTEVDLEPYQRMINPDVEGVSKILAGNYPDQMAEHIEHIRCIVAEKFAEIFAGGSAISFLRKPQGPAAAL